MLPDSCSIRTKRKLDMLTTRKIKGILTNGNLKVRKPYCTIEN
jgi:hypothetical protein